MRRCTSRTSSLFSVKLRNSSPCSCDETEPRGVSPVGRDARYASAEIALDECEARCVRLRPWRRQERGSLMSVASCVPPTRKGASTRRVS
eukprot:6194629-Pleurochrysis_carterae.AAC.1